MLEIFGATYTAGFYISNQYYLDNGLFLEYPTQGSEIGRHLSLMNFLGIASQETELEFPLTAQDEIDLDATGLNLIPNQYVCIHPGSRGAWRQWPTQYFAILADYAIDQGFKVVITGTTDELEIVSEVSDKMNGVPIIAAGKTTLGAVGILIKNAFVLISNCIGVSHIASAFKTPSIVIRMNGEPDRWAPLDKKVHRVFDWTVNSNFDQILLETQQILNCKDERIDVN